MNRILTFLLIVLTMSGFAFTQTQAGPASGGQYIASQYNYGGNGPLAPGPLKVAPGGGTNSTGAGTLILSIGNVGLQNGRKVSVLNVNAPITVDAGSNLETVTPTAVSCSTPEIPNTCSVTATFSFVHGAGAAVTSGTAGLQEAINDAFQNGGGLVVIDGLWTKNGGTNTLLTAAVPYPSVPIEDRRSLASIQNWNTQTGGTTLAAPATLTAATVGFGLNGATTTGGAYTGTNTYHYTISCVDIMGQEGPGSADFSAATAGTGAVNQIGFAAPAAQTGCVGYVPYISLTAGSYALSYKVPLVTQPTTAGAVPIGNGVCTLTVLETVTPACAITNATYGQTGSAAIVSALTLNTSPIVPAVTTVSSTTVYTPNAGGRTTAFYAPGSHIGAGGLNQAFLPFVISAAEASTVPSVLGTINVQPGFMNAVGRTIEICGKATTTASTATIVSIQFQWDAMGQNTAGKGVQLGNLSITPVAAFSTTKVITFCETFQTTVASASATGGSINSIGGFIATSGVSSAAAGQGAGSDATTGTVGSLNLAVDGRINVVSVHTTGTDGAALTLQSLTVRSAN